MYFMQHNSRNVDDIPNILVYSSLSTVNTEYTAFPALPYHWRGPRYRKVWFKNKWFWM